MSFPRFFVGAFALLTGAFAQVAIVGELVGGPSPLPEWLHVGAMTALVLPMLMGHDAGQAVTWIPREKRGARRWEGVVAASAGVYLVLGAVLGVVALGHPAVGAKGYLAAAVMVGALPAVLRLRRAVKRLRRAEGDEGGEEFVGGYRTRPPGPLLPDPPVVERAARRPARPAWVGRVGLLATGVALCLGGVVLMIAGRTPADRFHGALSVCFFGLCTWVFVEQLVGGQDMLTKRAGVRSVGVMILAGGVAGYLAWVTPEVSLIERVLVVLGGAALAGVGVWGQWRMWRRRGG